MGFMEELRKANVVITDEFKLTEYLREKSAYRYTQILNMLLSFNRPITDIHLNDFYRYDVRIRRLLFKYLTAYEISLRGQVLNSLKEGHKEVENLTFGQMLDKHYSSDQKIKKVKDLRNKIFHHNMIQLLDTNIVIESINIMLERMDKQKFANEIIEKLKDLKLIKAFILKGNNILYDYIGGS